jgi:hypothetical protein
MPYATRWNKKKRADFLKCIANKLHRKQPLSNDFIYEEAIQRGFKGCWKTLSRYLKSKQFFFSKAVRSSVLTPKHKQSRVAFASKAILDINERTVIMGDSSHFVKEVVQGLKTVSFEGRALAESTLCPFRRL